jgi:MATE family multidrug resistance protein
LQTPPDQASKTIREFDVTHKSIFAIAVPMTLAFLTTPLLGITDTAVVGQFANAALIGGLAIATIIFDLLFGTFNFLRSATTGLVAQAYGRGDEIEQKAVFWRSMLIGLVSGLIILVLHSVIISLGLYLMDASVEVAKAANEYFAIRVFSAPAALMNYALLGYVLGLGKGRLGLLLQILINGTNIALSFALGLGLEWGLSGVAIATVIAECFGLAIGLFIVLRGFKGTPVLSRDRIFHRASIMKLMALNGDIMIRSFALVGAFAWLTRMGGQFGDETLAANAILMNFLMLSGYLLDGFATAAEQLAGRAIGANYRPAFVKTVKLTLYWGFLLAGILMLIFVVLGPWLINIITNEPTVRSIATQYYIWAALISITGVLAFQMDGIFIGATWSSDMRNMMLLSLAGFIALSIIFTQIWGNHGLWISLNAFMLLRGVSLSFILSRKIHRIF